MASYHCTLKSGGKGSGSPHADYINREGKYAAIEKDRDKYSKYEDLVCKESGNMPEWAKEDPREFWKAADEFERAGGRSYTEIEIALPNELTCEQQKELVDEFIKEQIGENHAYSYAIHDKPAALNPQERNVNAHIMFSERKVDGIERDRQQYFKRGNSKNPERGGNIKDPDWNRREKVKEVRADWAAIQNKYLERYGHEVRVDHRNLEDQKISAVENGDIEKAKELNREPERHLGPKLAQKTVREAKQEMAKGKTKEEKIELRTQYYQRETTSEKSLQASLARQYKKEYIELQKEKVSLDVERIRQNVPIRTIEPASARKYAETAYWKQIEKNLIKDKNKLERDKPNFEKVKAAVDIRIQNCAGKLGTKDVAEMSRVTKWGEELRLKELQVNRRQKNFDNKIPPSDYEEKINKTTYNILKRDADRVEKLCELAHKMEPDKKVTIEKLKYMIELSIKTQQPIRDQLEKVKTDLEKKIISPKDIQKIALNVCSKGEYKRLERDRAAIEAEKARPGRTTADKVDLAKRIQAYNERLAAENKRRETPEAKAKMKELAGRIEKRNAPATREQLAKINEQTKTLDHELSELKGLSQKVNQTARDQKIEHKVQGMGLKLTPRNLSRMAGKLNGLVQNRGAAHTPKGRTEARIGDDDDLPKRGRSGPGHGD